MAVSTPHNSHSVPQEWLCPITYEIMKDPVIAPDTRTYERANIEEWLNIHHTSPFTREPMRIDQLVPNRALRDIITDGMLFRDQVQPSEGPIHIEHNPMFTRTTDTTIYCLIDRSGSMGLEIDTPGYESDGFSRLDLVKHSVRTIIHSLTPEYSLGIASFSQSARMDMEPVCMNGGGKARAIRIMEGIRETSTTNIWDGIRLIMTSHSRDDPPPTILLFTDGISNVDPPRGILATLEREMKRSGVRPTIHTIGFGYDIDSVMLHDIAECTGGVFGFIPDCTMIGSVFVNILSHVMSYTITRTIDCYWPELVEYLSEFAKASFAFDVDREKERIGRLLDVLTLRYDNSDTLRNVCTDIQDESEDKGQIEKAVSNDRWFKKWGKHYLLSLHLAHKNQVCLNFKDASLQDYKTDEFTAVQDVVESVFVNLPSPEPSNTRVREAIRSGAQMSTPMSVYYNASSGCFTGDTLVRVCDARSYTIAKDEPARFRPIRDLSPGDWVVSSNNESARIRFITKFRDHASKLTRLSGSLTISEYHPVRRYKGVSDFWKPKWEFPVNIAGSFETICDLYNLVLEPNENRRQMGVIYTPSHECVVFGHGICTDEVVTHDYFGTNAIVDDIAEEDEKQGSTGIVVVDRLQEIRDPETRMVVKYLFNE
jgi:hypothetical protein